MQVKALRNLSSDKSLIKFSSQTGMTLNVDDSDMMGAIIALIVVAAFNPSPGLLLMLLVLIVPTIRNFYMRRLPKCPLPTKKVLQSQTYILFGATFALVGPVIAQNIFYTSHHFKVTSQSNTMQLVNLGPFLYRSKHYLLVAGVFPWITIICNLVAFPFMIGFVRSLPSPSKDSDSDPEPGMQDIRIDEAEKM